MDASLIQVLSASRDYCKSTVSTTYRILKVRFLRKICGKFETPKVLPTEVGTLSLLEDTGLGGKGGGKTEGAPPKVLAQLNTFSWTIAKKSEFSVLPKSHLYNFSKKSRKTLFKKCKKSVTINVTVRLDSL